MKSCLACDIPKAVKMYNDPREWLICEPEHKELTTFLEVIFEHDISLTETQAIIGLTKAGVEILHPY